MRLGFLLFAVIASAQDARQLIEKSCTPCHNKVQKISDLDLSSREAAVKGGKRGPAVVPGDSARSPLYQALTGEGLTPMPPGKSLAPDEIAAIRAWIDAGAQWTPARAATDWAGYQEEDLWAFGPLRKVTATGIDGLLESTGPRADRRTLIRRATFDLHGLPPTPEDVDAFLNDRSLDAWPKLIERLLASSNYGERWARHWLDVVRYADSSGYSNDFERPNAWRYRDYVIRAFNSDKPYDRFILEQIAGDELFPDDPEGRIATGFLRAGPWEHTAMSVAAETRQMFLDDATHATASTFLGLTVGCARCHDHKFDPIPTRDYYRLQAVFATTAFARVRVPFLEQERRNRFEEGRKGLAALIAQAEARIAEYDALRKNRKLTDEEDEQLKLHRKHLSMHRVSAGRYEPFAFAVSSGLTDGQDDIGPGGAASYLKKVDYEKPATYVLTGGSIAAPAGKVAPGVLSLVERYSGSPAPEIPETVSGRRAALARWIADPRNPLTARVMANRVWQYHFGRGIAENASNLGKMGKKPSNPELLDWLAQYFIDRKWSMKALHRVILLSEAYQRSREPLRVEAEVLRDSMLAVSGELSSDAGGPGVFPRINRNAAEQPRHAMGSLMPAYYPSPSRRDRNRRSIYTFQQRSLIDPMIEVFNGPSLDLSCERRDSTTVPTQAFTLFNGEVVYELALAFASRVAREASDTNGRIRRMYALAFQRAPTPAEQDAVRAHLARATDFHRKNPPPAASARRPLVRSITSELTGENFKFEEALPPGGFEESVPVSALPPGVRALADVALVLFNSNEFAYVY
jgi:cytochrome c553